MNTSNLQYLQQCIGYKFDNKALLQQALTHRSYHTVNNERLEFLGDALLSAAISEYLYHRFPDVKEGILSRLRASLVKGETLAELAVEFNLSDYLIMGSGELKSGGFRRKSILADTVEALIGAIFIDSNIQTCQQCLLRWFSGRLEQLSADDQLKDPKTTLQELMQANKLPLPVYTVDNIEGASHQQSFTVSCQVALLDNKVQSCAGSRRQAEKKAAQVALQQIEALKSE